MSIRDSRTFGHPGDIEEVSDAPDEQTASWQDDQARKRGRLELELLALDLTQRRQYALGLFLVLVGWLVAVLLLLFLCGAQMLELSDSVLIATLGTTTANVIGLFIVVAKYIFRRDPV